jgi:hypothetical protein
MAAFDPEDVFDLNNPDDLADFNQLYRRISEGDGGQP